MPSFAPVVSIGETAKPKKYHELMFLQSSYYSFRAFIKNSSIIFQKFSQTVSEGLIWTQWGHRIGKTIYLYLNSLPHSFILEESREPLGALNYGIMWDKTFGKYWGSGMFHLILMQVEVTIAEILAKSKIH